MKSNHMKLRLLWIVPNVFLYLCFIGLSVFVLINSTELAAIHELAMWVIMLILLLGAALFGTIRIISWIRQGKL